LKSKENNAGFEANLAAMEELVKKMEAGGLSLAETMACYEAGIKLSGVLKAELEKAEKRLMLLKDGKITPADDKYDV
jgi:exodeoxyribonuclease VII small subunit